MSGVVVDVIALRLLVDRPDVAVGRGAHPSIVSILAHLKWKGISRSLCAALALATIVACAGDRPTGRLAGPPPFDPGPVPARLVAGGQDFTAFCSGCHGAAGSGFAGGPALLDTLYLSDRLSDDSIRRIVLAGAPARHWDFGPMPPVRALPPDRIPPVIAYLRWVQAAWVAGGDSSPGSDRTR